VLPVASPPPGATSLWGLGTAVPATRVTQAQAASFMARSLARDGGPSRERAIHRMAERSGIRARHTVLADFAEDDPARFTFFPNSRDLEPFPTTADRLEVFERDAVPLAAAAARRALADAAVAPEAVTHLVVTTCTGFYAPGPDQDLLTALGLRSDVKRTLIGFMGCYAGFNGLRAADDIVRAHPEAIVLQVAVELCTLHMQKGPETETLVANLLFSDGASAAVYAGDRTRPTRRSGARARIAGTHSELSLNTRDQMSWRIGDHGFVMRLSPDVPHHLGVGVGGFLDALCEASNVRRPQLDQLAVHPGGRRVLEATRDALDVPQSALAASHRVLADHGNMSSATILFVIDRALERATGPIAALGFGPGLTMEGAVLIP